MRVLFLGLFCLGILAAVAYGAPAQLPDAAPPPHIWWALNHQTAECIRFESPSQFMRTYQWFRGVVRLQNFPDPFLRIPDGIIVLDYQEPVNVRRIVFYRSLASCQEILKRLEAQGKVIPPGDAVSEGGEARNNGGTGSCFNRSLPRLGLGLKAALATVGAITPSGGRREMKALVIALLLMTSEIALTNAAPIHEWWILNLQGGVCELAAPVTPYIFKQWVRYLGLFHYIHITREADGSIFGVEIGYAETRSSDTVLTDYFFPSLANCQAYLQKAERRGLGASKGGSR
jgi:hypothetical protein